MRDYLIGVLVHWVGDATLNDIMAKVPIRSDLAELGVSEVAKLHLATSTPNLTYAIGSHYPHVEDDMLIGGGMVKDPRVVLRNDSRLSLKSAAGVPLT